MCGQRAPLPASGLHTQLLLGPAGQRGSLVSNDKGFGHQLASACHVLSSGHTFSSLELTIISPILWLGKPRLSEVTRLARGTQLGRGGMGALAHPLRHCPPAPAHTEHGHQPRKLGSTAGPSLHPHTAPPRPVVIIITVPCKSALPCAGCCAWRGAHTVFLAAPLKTHCLPLGAFRAGSVSKPLAPGYPDPRNGTQNRVSLVTASPCLDRCPACGGHAVNVRAEWTRHPPPS